MFSKFFLYLSLSIILVTSSYAKSGCELAQIGEVKVSWTAYKTPLKVGVGGVFNEIKYTPIAPKGNNFRSILVGSSVLINTTNVNSKNEGRDNKLRKYFFEKMYSKEIQAKIIDIKANKRVKKEPRTGIVTIEVTMNSKTIKVPMKYIYKKGIFKANGTIDLFDFSAQKALSGINKACYELHDGKTWNDVNISFEMQITAILCK